MHWAPHLLLLPLCRPYLLPLPITGATSATSCVSFAPWALSSVACCISLHRNPCPVEEPCCRHAAWMWVYFVWCLPVLVFGPVLFSITRSYPTWCHIVCATASAPGVIP